MLGARARLIRALDCFVCNEVEIMRRFSLRFAIALLTFSVGISAATVWYMNSSTFSRTVEEENIMELVFRHQIEEEGKSEGAVVFFLSHAEDPDTRNEL